LDVLVSKAQTLLGVGNKSLEGTFTGHDAA